MATMEELFKIMKAKNASDLHLTTGVPPILRVNGKLYATPFDPLTPEESQNLIYSIMTEDQKQRFEQHNELDFGFSMEGMGRLRINIYRQRGAMGAAIRSIPYDFKTFEELHVPKIAYDLMNLNRGLVLVIGPTGCGKSTTLASMINYLNENKNYHIVTVEDPIEFVHTHKKSIVNQREIGNDTESFQNALRHILRQDPDVILVGELRDLETIQHALNVAETGHLVLATLHTSDASQTINRIVDVFPPNQQEQVRVQLSFVLQGIISQHLLEKADGKGRILATEVLITNSAIRNLIREGKIEQIASAIQTGGDIGMHSLNQSLVDLYLDNTISYQEALERCSDVADFKKYLQQQVGKKK